jgi:hypothetical protein
LNSKIKNTIFEYEYELELRISEEMSPEFKLLTFFVDNQEIIPDSASINLDRCFKNKINFTLGSKTLQVGKRVEMSIKSEPNSICAITGIDKSVTFMGQRNSVNIQKVNILKPCFFMEILIKNFYFDRFSKD